MRLNQGFLNSRLRLNATQGGWKRLKGLTNHDKSMTLINQPLAPDDDGAARQTGSLPVAPRGPTSAQEGPLARTSPSLIRFFLPHYTNGCVLLHSLKPLPQRRHRE